MFLLLTLTKKMFSGIVTVCLVYSNIMKTMILFYLKTSMCHNFITRFQQIIKLAISECYQKHFPSVSKSSNIITRYLLHNMIIMLKIFEEDGFEKKNQHTSIETPSRSRTSIKTAGLSLKVWH